MYIDGLFGQCWNGQGSVRSAFAAQDGVDGLSDDKLIAIDTTIDFLNRYHLDWKEYMTQCILSHILSTEHSVNGNRLESFYSDCLEKDQELDEYAAVQEAEEEEQNLNRRQLSIYDLNKGKTQTLSLLFFSFFIIKFF